MTPKTWTESDRLAALESYAILDTPLEPEFDDIARLAAEVLESPIAVVNLIANGRQWFKAEIGIGARELPLDVSICAHAILQHDTMVVTDTREDPRFVNNPLVTVDDGLRFYAGALLKTPEGLPLGTVCVLDRRPRPEGITPRQQLALELLARQVMTQLELRKTVALYSARAREIEIEVRGRQAAQDAQAVSEARYRSLFNSIDAGFCIIEMAFDAEGVAKDYRFMEVNDAFARQTGLTDAVGQWMRQLAPDHEQHWFDVYGRVATTGEPVRFENAAQALDDRWYDVHAFRMGPAGARHVAVLFNDITDRRRSELQLIELNETLDRRVEEAVAEQTRAEEALRQSQKMEAIGQLTGGIAHDFNNMLGVVIGGLDLLQRRLQRGDTDVGRYIDGAMEGAERAAALTQRLLAFSRQQPLAPAAIDSNRLVADMSELLIRTLGETVTVETVLAEDLWKAKADPSQLENVILNLAVNARDAMPEGGRLLIETSNVEVDANHAIDVELDSGQYVMLAVSDTGSGMTPEVMAKAFDPFFTTKPVGKGTGLGLSQVFGFVRQSGGQVRIYSEVDHGTTFKIYLPRFWGAEAPAPLKAAAQPRGGEAHEIILVVEDEQRVRHYSVEALRELGYGVIHASNGAEALEIIRRGEAVDLLFTDIVMPEMTGRQLADQALALRPDLKVIYTTGYTRNAVVHSGVIDPGVNFLAKPFGIRQLGGLVRAVLDEDRSRP
ncbi:ATP-binding protein [Phenylobacterium sp.]|uniref:hybrid sensor histidine kinase/response regulator n=1 Tax=Phenylobacterium sp. TaxID=1871053 RepID=UPI0027329B53|nr:ATP-binding protein [Phenylobacterium sp.]MDP3592168.1 ATP-binding protein [Phenylobacterium sp.]